MPTKDRLLRPLPLAQLGDAVARFQAYAAAHPQQQFEVTRVGCGLAGFADGDIAPLFALAPRNCVLAYRWQRLLRPALPARVIVAGSRDFNDAGFLTAKLDRLLRRLSGATLVSGGARGADRLGEAYARARGRPLLVEPAQWDRYGHKAAGWIRNQRMSWLASHLVAFWDGASSGTRNMIATARRDGLEVRVVRVDCHAPAG